MRVSPVLLCALVALACVAVTVCARRPRHDSTVDSSNIAEAFAEHERDVIATQKHHHHHQVDSPQSILGPGAFGLDLSVAVDTATFECMKDKGYSFLIQRLWRSLCLVDSAAVASVDAAWEAGFQSVDVYLYPNRTCVLGPEEQVEQALAAMKGHQFGTFWFDVELNHSGWTKPDENAAWLARAVKSAVDQLGVERVGIYTSPAMWSDVMANATQFSDLALWYAHYDNVPAFSDWFQFSGWQNPRVKQFYDGPDVCGVSGDHNWAPL